MATLRDIEDDGPLSFRASVTTEDGDEISGRHRFYKGHYDEHVQRDPERERRDWRDMRGMIETSWGYAIKVRVTARNVSLSTVDLPAAGLSVQVVKRKVG